MQNRYKNFLSSVGLVALLLASANANAQDNSQAASKENDNSNLSTPEVVIVTARFHSESAQKAPTAITAISGASLSARGLTNVQDLSAAVPNAFIAPPTGATGPSALISMRGISQEDWNFAFESPVGIYIDDVYRPTLMGSALDLMDLDRVEVLRGPQGTVFGKNSMGGAIRLFSKQPKGDNSGFFEVTGGSYGRIDFKGGFDTEIIPDKLFMRVSAAEKHVKGYVKLLDFACEMTKEGKTSLIPAGIIANPSAAAKNCQTGTEGGEDMKAARILLRYLASDKLELNLATDVTYDDREVNPDVLIGTVAAANLPALIPSAAPWNSVLANGPTPIYDSRFVPPNNYSSYANITTGNVSSIHEGGVSGTANYKVNDKMQAKLILAWRQFNSDFSYNPDASPYGFGENSNPIKHSQQSAELQLTGEALNDKFEWAAGGMIFSAKTYLGGHIIYTTQSFDQDDHYTDKSSSAFVHGIYHFTDKLALTTGLRYSSVEKGYTYHHPGILDDSFSSKYSENHTDWLLNLEYKPTSEVSVYAQAASGFRPGGVNPRALILPDQLIPFNGEELISYEGGIKSRLFNNRVTFNLAGFYSDYSSHISQSTVFECLTTKKMSFTPGGCPDANVAPWFYYFNDKAAIHGIEAELEARPVDNMRVNASVGWNKGESKVKDQTAPNYRDPSNLFQPEWNANAGAEYRFKIANGGTVTPRIDINYRSKMTFNPNLATPATDIVTAKGYAVTNVRLTYDDPGSKWGATVGVTNLFDKFYWYNKFALNGFAYSGVPSRPREWFVTLRRNF